MKFRKVERMEKHLAPSQLLHPPPNPLLPFTVISFIFSLGALVITTKLKKIVGH